MSNNFKRTRLLVDSAFQFRLLARMALYLFLFAFVGFHMAFLYEVMANIASNGLRKQMADFYMDFLRQQRSGLLAVATLTPMLLYDLLKFSNRIAGPLHRCRKVMQEMAEGKTAPAFKPRKHDLMREFFQTFDDLIQAWNHRVGATVVNDDANSPQPDVAGTDMAPVAPSAVAAAAK